MVSEGGRDYQYFTHGLDPSLKNVQATQYDLLQCLQGALLYFITSLNLSNCQSGDLLSCQYKITADINFASLYSLSSKSP